MYKRQVREIADPEAVIIFGAGIDESLGDEVRITIIATGFDKNERPSARNAGVYVPQAARSAAPAAPAAERPAATPYQPEARPAAATPAAPAPAPAEEPELPSFFRNNNRRRSSRLFGEDDDK